MTDDPNLSELLDDDKLPEEYPPERPLGVEDPGVTADHGAIGDSVAERAAREEPDVVAGPPSEAGTVGHLVEPGGDQGRDVDADLVATAVGGNEHGARAAGDIASGSDTDREVATERIDDRSEEELAVHVTEAPPLLDEDSYLDEEPPA